MASIIIESTSPLIQYSENDWTATRHIGDASVHCAISDGFLNFTAEFNYAGVWAYYYSGDSVRLTCVIDGTTPIDGSDPPRAADGSAAASWLSWLVCETPTTLAQQKHTLEVRVSSASENTQFCFDQIELRTSQLAANLDAAVSPTTPTDTSATTAATATPATGAGRRGEAGAIAGWTVGGIVLTLAICGGLFFWYRWRKQRAHRYERTSSEDDDYDRSRRMPFGSTAWLNSWLRKHRPPHDDSTLPPPPVESAWLEARGPVSQPRHALPRPLSTQGVAATRARRESDRASQATVTLAQLGLDPSTDSHADADSDGARRAHRHSPDLVDAQTERRLGTLEAGAEVEVEQELRAPGLVQSPLPLPLSSHTLTSARRASPSPPP